MSPGGGAGGRPTEAHLPHPRIHGGREAARSAMRAMGGSTQARVVGKPGVTVVSWYFVCMTDG